MIQQYKSVIIVDDMYLVRCFQIPSFKSISFVVVPTLTRIIKSVVTGQAPSVYNVD